MFKPLTLLLGIKRAIPARQTLGINMLQGMETQTVAFEGLPLPQTDSSGEELCKLALLYSTGQGGAPLDYVSAHMLFNLAAMRGSEEAKSYRRELSREMAHEDVAEAQRQAREWISKAS